VRQWTDAAPWGPAISRHNAFSKVCKPLRRRRAFMTSLGKVSLAGCQAPLSVSLLARGAFEWSRVRGSYLEVII